MGAAAHVLVVPPCPPAPAWPVPGISPEDSWNRPQGAYSADQVFLDPRGRVPSPTNTTLGQARRRARTIVVR